MPDPDGSAHRGGGQKGPDAALLGDGGALRRGDSWPAARLSQAEEGQFGQLPLHLPGRGRPNARHGLRRGGGRNNELLQVPEANAALLSHLPEEVPGLREGHTSTARRLCGVLLRRLP